MSAPSTQAVSATSRPPATNSSFLGFLFLGYALFCLCLVIVLSEKPLKVPVRIEAPEKLVALVKITPMPDFEAISDIQAKKAAFFSYLLPAIEAQNRQLNQTHEQLLTLKEQLTTDRSLKQNQVQHLNRLAEKFQLKSAEPMQLVSNLLVRADELPAAMVLAQAAMESAWGTSRFAREANNLFGQWCFTSGCGLVPQRRPEGESYEVKAFNSVNDAIEAYFLNINTHAAYQQVRTIRSQARFEKKPLRGMDMVAGLEKYSGRGQAYIEELRSVIHSNSLE